MDNILEWANSICPYPIVDVSAQGWYIRITLRDHDDLIFLVLRGSGVWDGLHYLIENNRVYIRRIP